MMIKFKPRMFSRRSKKSDKVEKPVQTGDDLLGEIKWELRPGGMLVQKRDSIGGSHQKKEGGESLITIRISSMISSSHWHDVSIESTSSFGELKAILSIITGLEPREQRLLYRGKERRDDEHLHMVGISDKDKILLLEDPAIKEMKLRSTRSMGMNEAIGAATSTHHHHHLHHHQQPYRAITV